jgi:hypothetical protein
MGERTQETWVLEANFTGLSQKQPLHTVPRDCGRPGDTSRGRGDCYQTARDT